MTSLKRGVKDVMQKTGLFPLARAVYRNVSRTHRRERAFNAGFFGSIVRPGDLCFDIGANLGQTVEVLAGIGATVIALEPNPLCRPVLEFHFRRSNPCAPPGRGCAPGKCACTMPACAAR